jgi:nucleoid DNA-binding protein
VDLRNPRHDEAKIEITIGAISARGEGKMNKRDLVQYISVVTEISGAAASRAVDAVFAGITQALRQGDDVTLIDFGSLSVRRRLPVTVVIRARARPSRSPR